jgi:chaperone modulatory protein CbpM
MTISLTISTSESIWLNNSDICSLAHIAEVSGLTEHDILDLVEAGILEPTNSDSHNYFFRTDRIAVARMARRLRDDFELNANGLALALNLLQQIRDLEDELASLRRDPAR